MNTSLTEIAYILDRSGSMSRHVEPAVAAFNRFIKEQASVPGEVRFTLVLFDDQYEVLWDARPLREIPELTRKTYLPRGTTALLDAMGRTIAELGQKLAREDEAARPGQVIVAIFTDGLENASRHYTAQQIADMIAHQRDVYKWQFLFLGANQDAIATAAQYNIAARDAAAFAMDQQGIRSTSASLHRKIRSLRKAAAGCDLSVAEKQDLDAPLSKLTEEEDRSLRKDSNPPRREE
jgi:Mg-chelatase subunit ChlD